MYMRQRKVLLITCAAALAVGPSAVWGQQVPSTSARPWNSPRSLTPTLTKEPAEKYQLSRDHVYTLAELIDLAEEHDPETRAAWEAAKQQAAALKVARSELFPTLAAAAMAQTLQTGVLLYNQFVLQQEGIGQGYFALNYTLLDFGARQERIATQRANLLAADFSFNDTHRRIIFQTMSSYYQLLNANGQNRAAQANLQNAQAVQQAAEARLEHGLATLPDVLETRSATAQAEYDLQATVGMQEAAAGDLATLLAASLASQFRVEDIDAPHVPDQLEESVDDLIHRALQQRPDLLARFADIAAAQAGVKGARSAYYPSMAFQGNWGRLRSYGVEPPYPATYAAANVYNAQLTLSWTIFDGGRRRGELDEAKASEKRAEAEADAARDNISDEVWRSYSDMKTALRQRTAATTLLQASSTSYDAALGAYYTLLFSRDSTRATVRSVLRSVSAVGVSLLYIITTVRLFAGEPFLHFMWVAGTLFITFFLISALSEYLAGTAFGFLAVTSIAAWDFPADTNVLFREHAVDRSGGTAGRGSHRCSGTDLPLHPSL